MISIQPELNPAPFLFPNLTFARVEVNTTLAQVDKINYKCHLFTTSLWMNGRVA